MEDKEILQDRYEKHIKNLFKSFLYILEDLNDDHNINFAKLKRSLPQHADLIDQANYFDKNKMLFLRKRVLDLGNDSLRNQTEDLEKFTVIFNFKT
tara:strand:- start:3281 stop:3568 length:288 start_codon:yes stop_codon:yes gene_type:complete